MLSQGDVNAQFETKYRSARFVLFLADIFGKAAILIGLTWLGWSIFAIVAKLLSLSIGGNADLSLVMSVLALWPSAGLIGAGILIFANGQLVLAALDTADYARMILARMEPQSSKD